MPKSFNFTVFSCVTCIRKQHLLYKRRNLCYLLIYTRSESFIDVLLLLTSETFLYRNAVERSLNKSNPTHESAGEERDGELFAVVFNCWNNVWKKRQLRRERQKPPYQCKAVIYLLTVVKVDQGGQYKCWGGTGHDRWMVGIKKGWRLCHPPPTGFIGKRYNQQSKYIEQKNTCGKHVKLVVG